MARNRKGGAPRGRLKRPPAPDIELASDVPVKRRLEVSLRMAQDPATPPRVRLDHVRRLHAMVDELEAGVWRDARAASFSWTQLGDTVMITRSAAQQRASTLWKRYGIKPPTAHRG